MMKDDLGLLEREVKGKKFRLGTLWGQKVRE